jgi:hypothetical protein
MAIQQAQPVPGQDLAEDFDADWQKAQKRFQDYSNQAYTTEQNNFIASVGEQVRRHRGSSAEVAAALDEAKQKVESEKSQEADALYLSPIREKWKIIQSAPDTFADKSKRNKINEDFENAQESAVKNLTRDEPTEQTVMSRVAPLAQKWMIAAQFPTTPKIPTTPSQVAAWYAKNPAMQSEEKETLKQVGQGVPETEAILAHPTLLQNAPFAARWNPRLTTAVNRDQRANAKSVQPPNIESLANKRNSLFNRTYTIDPSTSQPVERTNIPKSTLDAYKGEIENIDFILTPFNKGVKLSPPPDAATQTEADPSAAPQPAARTNPRNEFPVIGTESEYNALKPGEKYYDAQGNLRRKK